MARDIDLTSPQWTSLIFEGKNKEYGAYEMRNDSSNRHLKALIIITILGLAAIYLPNLIHKSVPAPVSVAQPGDVKLIDVNLYPVNTADKIVEPTPIAPTLKRTIQFVPPVVVPDPEATKHLATQDDLTNSQAQISVATVDVPLGGTVDIRDVPQITGAPPKQEIPERVEQMPQFPGGEAEMMKWLSSNIIYPSIAIDQNIQGRVIVKFVVRSDGSIDNVQIVKSLDPSCDKEAIRAVKKMPNWVAGRQNGNAVSVWYTLPILFRLQNR